MQVVAVLGEEQQLHWQERHGQVGQHLQGKDQTIFRQSFLESEEKKLIYALIQQRKAKYHFNKVSIVEEWTPAGAGGGEHEQRAEGNEEQDQGEQEEIHGVYDFLKIFSSNINFVYSIWRKCCSCFEKFRSALSNYLV